MDSEQTSTNSEPTTQRRKVKRATIRILDKKFQFKVALLVVGLITLTHLIVGSYIYHQMADFARKMSDFVPDLEPDVIYFRDWILKSMVFTIVVTFLLVILLSLYFSSRISGPLFNMIRVFGQVSRGDLSKRVTLRKNDELQEFSGEVNRLFDILEAQEKKRQAVIAELRALMGSDAKIVKLIDELSRPQE